MLILIRLITNKIEICLLKPFCCFGISDLIWDLEFEDSRFWFEIRFKIWDLAWRFESPVKKIWDFRVRFDLRFAHHWSVLNECPLSHITACVKVLSFSPVIPGVKHSPVEYHFSSRKKCQLGGYFDFEIGYAYCFTFVIFYCFFFKQIYLVWLEFGKTRFGSFA